MAIEPVALEMLGAWPSKITRYSFSWGYSSRRVILFYCAPKMSGRFRERDYRFLRMSTSSPWAMLATLGAFFFWPRQVLRCLFISEARMFWRQAWHCCRNSRFLGSEMIFSSMLLGAIECCWIRVSSSPLAMFLLCSVSKLMVSTSSKSFQSMLLSLVCLACCSFLPLACICREMWQSQTSLQVLKISSRLPRYLVNRCVSSSCISRMLVQASTNLMKQRLFLEAGRRNQNCGLFFSRSLRATRKFLPFLAEYCAVCWIMACSPSLSFSGSSAMYFSGSGSLSSMKIFSRKAACSGCGSSLGFTGSSILASSLGSSALMPWIIFLLISATRWSQYALYGLSALRKANSGLCCYLSINIFSNQDPLRATCSAVFSNSSKHKHCLTLDLARRNNQTNHLANLLQKCQNYPLTDARKNRL